MSEGKERHITGGCHCGALRYTAILREPVQGLDCNCSICRATGYLHINVRHEDVTMDIKEGALTTYRFGSGKAAHTFCKICGVKPFYQPRSHPNHWSINANCVDGGIPEGIEFTRFDGTNWEDNVDSIR